jgi:hypothetical protein
MASARPGQTRRRVLVHGFGEYAILYSHMIGMAKREAPELDFAIILPTSHHLDVLRTHLPDERIFCLEDHLSRQPPSVSDLSQLANYHGNIHADIEAEKKTLKFRPAAFQLARAVEIYRFYKDFITAFQPEHILLSHVESYEQKMLESLGHELGIPVSVPTDLRTIGGSFMAPDTQETLPKERPVTDAHREKARAFVAAFREGHRPALNFPIPEAERGVSLPVHSKPLVQRVSGFARRYLRHSDQFEWDYLRAAVLNNMPMTRDLWWKWKTRRAGKLFHIDSVEKLPEKLIYYPLHLTPESSINTPAPYYVDQFRVIDAIRMAMPSDYHLVVKEHYVSVMVRPIGFMRQLLNRSGVTVIQYTTPGREVIQRAALTISVTGTSTLEAFLLGKPTLALGSMFMTEFYGGAVPLSELAARIRKALAEKPDDAHLIESIAQVMSVSQPFTIFHVNQPGNPAHSEGNIRNLIAALKAEMSAR